MRVKTLIQSQKQGKKDKKERSEQKEMLKKLNAAIAELDEMKEARGAAPGLALALVRRAHSHTVTPHSYSHA